jgi:hypothetical protein
MTRPLYHHPLPDFDALKVSAFIRPLTHVQTLFRWGNGQIFELLGQSILIQPFDQNDLKVKLLQTSAHPIDTHLDILLLSRRRTGVPKSDTPQSSRNELQSPGTPTQIKRRRTARFATQSPLFEGYRQIIHSDIWHRRVFDGN